LVKGGDWEKESVIGREVVESDGGKVVIIPTVEGVASSGIVQRVLEKYTKT
jgi:bifunctional ADP-heptose synthase (sugar kinase/adenylyltransferase)